MILEIVGFIGIIILILFFLAEFTKQPILGIFASIILLILAFWIYTDGLSINNGYTETSIEGIANNFFLRATSGYINNSFNQSGGINATYELDGFYWESCNKNNTDYTMYFNISNIPNNTNYVDVYVFAYHEHNDGDDYYIYNGSNYELFASYNPYSAQFKLSQLNFTSLTSKYFNNGIIQFKIYHNANENKCFYIDQIKAYVNQGSINKNETKINTYENIDNTNFIHLNELIGLIFILLSLYGLYESIGKFSKI